MTPGQIVTGHYLATNAAYDAVLSTTYAESQNLKVGSSITLGGKSFKVVGLSTAPIGGNASDVYVSLATLQKIAPGWSGQITNLQVEATSGSTVSAVKHEITSRLNGAQVTTAADTAKRITGSLTDAKNIAGTLGTALEILGLVAAVLFALLLTLTSVARRTREIGTLRAVGWSKVTVVRQISLETLAQGVFGGIAGVIIGLATVAGINAAGWTLQASVAPATQAGPFGFGRFAGGGFARAFGQAASTASTSIPVHASVDLALLGLAIGLAVLGGLIAGSIGGFRASALRPATALRNIE
jgi:ABC-type antimicrobial peptide transport system permease subunit